VLIIFKKEVEMLRISIIQNVDTNEYFFTKDHCQPMPYGSSWVPTTFTLPYSISPREGFESGIIENQKDIKRFLNTYNKEIENPNASYKIGGKI